jgi:YHS domain-containing protein
MPTMTGTTVRSVLCPTCGCSLVRLGVTREQSVHASRAGTLYFFCCAGCADTFRTDPEHYLARIADVVVCPVCLAEKPITMTVSIEHEGRTVHFCECPYCLDNFTNDPDTYLSRLDDW